MSFTYGSDKKSAIDAKHDAQKIAFAPIMFHAARALRDMGIFECLLNHRRGKGCTLTQISEESGVSEYGVKVLLEAGLSLDVVMVEDDYWKITKTGYFVAKDDLTRINMDFTNDVCYRGMESLQEAIKNGKPEGLKALGDWPTIYEGLSILPEPARTSWFDFDHYYSDLAFPEIEPYVFDGSPKHILDVGGNTGKFSIFCASRHPEVKMTILDLPVQINVANKNITEAGLENQIDTFGIDLLDQTFPFPKGADAIWMSQFLDCFSQDEILSLLQRSYNALDANGALYILETYWDRQQFPASTYSLHATSLYFTAMANGNSQMYHSRDLEALIKKAGMKIVDHWDGIGVSHTLMKCMRV